MDYATVVRCLNQAEADLKAAELRAGGFEVLERNENAAHTTAVPLTVGGILVQVRRDQLEAARSYLEAGDSAA